MGKTRTTYTNGLISVINVREGARRGLHPRDQRADIVDVNWEITRGTIKGSINVQVVEHTPGITSHRSILIPRQQCPSLMHHVSALTCYRSNAYASLEPTLKAPEARATEMSRWYHGYPPLFARPIEI